MTRPSGTSARARLYVALALFLGLTGLAQMPIFKRYYVADLPGLGWLADFYTTLALHYAAAIVFLALCGYFAARWYVARRVGAAPGLSGSGALRAALVAGIVLTGLARVAKNLPSWSFDPTTTMLVDWTHLGFAAAYAAAALGARITGAARYLAARHEEPDL
ncbi:MAG: hypothetical protein H0S85_08290 [Desulfovibrionaceae bacterium]|jgi:hypothetical protein|nr:hypothetical protein [Desulfovibrionaceae bacterium]